MITTGSSTAEEVAAGFLFTADAKKSYPSEDEINKLKSDINDGKWEALNDWSSNIGVLAQLMLENMEESMSSAIIDHPEMLKIGELKDSMSDPEIKASKVFETQGQKTLTRSTFEILGRVINSLHWISSCEAYFDHLLQRICLALL